jgi:amino acid adenylation domain-containing protein
MTLATPFYECSLRDPDHAALRLGSRTFSYGELRSLSACVAGRLGPGVGRVGILASRSAAAYAGVLGTLFAGGTFVPLDPTAPLPRLADLVARTRLAALIVDDAGRQATEGHRLRTTHRFLHVSEDGECAELGGEAGGGPRGGAPEPIASPVPVEAGAAAYIMFTSGTTGRPKGVVVSHGNVLVHLRNMQERFRIGPDDRVSQFFDLTFDPVVFDLFMAFGHGASLHVVPAVQRLAPVAFIRSEALTVWYTVPSIVGGLLKMNMLRPGLFPTLRHSFFVGEPLPESYALRWQEAAPNSSVHNLYGPTEVTHTCFTHRLGSLPQTTPERGTIPIGRPDPGTRAAILDSERRFLPAGEAGELALAGPQVSDGYWGDPDLTAEKFVRLGEGEAGGAERPVWYLTGDQAYRGADGTFHLLGRIDNQVKIRGHRVELEEVEHQVRRAARCDSAAAVAWPVVDGFAQGLVAFVAGTSLAPADIKAALAEQLPAYMVPQRILVLPALPLTARFKVDRRALRAQLD